LNNIVWLDVPSTGYFWYLDSVQAVQIGENFYTNEGRTAGYSYPFVLQQQAYFDSGVSMIYTPEGLGYEITKRLVAGKTYEWDWNTGMMFVDCSEKRAYEPLYLWIDDYMFEILVDDYFIEYNEEPTDS
jgi:hypothetical protein